MKYLQDDKYHKHFNRQGLDPRKEPRPADIIIYGQGNNGQEGSFKSNLQLCDYRTLAAVHISLLTLTCTYLYTLTDFVFFSHSLSTGYEVY